MVIVSLHGGDSSASETSAPFRHFKPVSPPRRWDFNSILIKIQPSLTTHRFDIKIMLRHGNEDCFLPVAATRGIMVKDETHKPVIVVIDDEVQLRRLLRVSLEANGYKVYEAPDGKQGLAEVAARHPDLVVLDMGLPDMDGMEVVARLREWSAVPIVVVSVRESEIDKVTALRGGADDYLTKPFSTAELLARLQVAQRHAQPAAEETVFTSGPLAVDLAARTVKVKGQPIKLTRTEYALLRLFVRNAGKVLTHPQIMESVWGPGHREKTHYLHVYMTHLREKIETTPAKPELLVTEPRVGYRLNTESSLQFGSRQLQVKSAATEN
jgi:two-component system KDP operon response regulator KdpE